MEISPIPGIRAMPVVKTPPADSEMLAVFDVEAPARMGDDGYTPSEEKHATADDNEEAEGESAEAADSDETGRATPAIPADTEGKISFFA